MHHFLGQDVLAFGVCGAVRFPVVPFACVAYWGSMQICEAELSAKKECVCG